MSNFRIFTESNADIKFLKDYLKEVYNTSLLDSDFDPLGSWAGYKSDGKPKASIIENYENNKNSILILDADSDFEARKMEVLSDFEKFGIPIKLFLFPNNQAQGSLETLLCEIAVEKKIISCFEAYEKCITGFQSPVIKSKIFAYLDALLPSNQKKGNSIDLISEKNRDYRNAHHWDLNNAFLDPLKAFLQQFS